MSELAPDLLCRLVPFALSEVGFRQNEKNYIVSGHTAWNAPDPFRTPKLSLARPG